MKKIVFLMVSLIAFNAFAQFPISYNAKTCDVSRVSGQFDSFKWNWIGQTDQSNTLWIAASLTNGYPAGWIQLTGFYTSFRISKRGTVYVDVPYTAMTINGSNVTFAISRTNIPPDDTYNAELWMISTTSTNYARTLAQGTINVTKSLYQDTNYFPFPAPPGLPYLPLAINASASGYVPIASGTNGLLWYWGPASSAGGMSASVYDPAGTNEQLVGIDDYRLSNARTPTAHNQAWSTITATPDNLSGYGITDTLVHVETDAIALAALVVHNTNTASHSGLFATPAQGIAGTNAQTRVAILETNTATKAQGIAATNAQARVSVLETNTASLAQGVAGTNAQARVSVLETNTATLLQGSHGDSAYSWGNHALVGYLTNGTPGTWTNLSQYNNDAGFLTASTITNTYVSWVPTVPPGGPYSFDNPTNWSTGRLPTNTDVVLMDGYTYPAMSADAGTCRAHLVIIIGGASGMWFANPATVYGDVVVYGDDNLFVGIDGTVYGNVTLYQASIIGINGVVYGDLTMYGTSQNSGTVFGKTRFYDSSVDTPATSVYHDIRYSEGFWNWPDGSVFVGISNHTITASNFVGSLNWNDITNAPSVVTNGAVGTWTNLSAYWNDSGFITNETLWNAVSNQIRGLTNCVLRYSATGSFIAGYDNLDDAVGAAITEASRNDCFVLGKGGYDVSGAGQYWYDYGYSFVGQGRDLTTIADAFPGGVCYLKDLTFQGGYMYPGSKLYLDNCRMIGVSYWQLDSTYTNELNAQYSDLWFGSGTTNYAAPGTNIFIYHKFCSISNVPNGFILVKQDAYLTNGTAGTWTNLSSYWNDAGFITNGSSGTWTNLSQYNNDAGYLTNGYCVYIGVDVNPSLSVTNNWRFGRVPTSNDVAVFDMNNLTYLPTTGACNARVSIFSGWFSAAAGDYYGDAIFNDGAEAAGARFHRRVIYMGPWSGNNSSTFYGPIELAGAVLYPNQTIFVDWSNRSLYASQFVGSIASSNVTGLGTIATSNTTDYVRTGVGLTNGGAVAQAAYSAYSNYQAAANNASNGVLGVVTSIYQTVSAANGTSNNILGIVSTQYVPASVAVTNNQPSVNFGQISATGGQDTAYAPIIKAYGNVATGDLTTEGLKHGHWIAVDGVANSQKGFVWAEAGTPYWNVEIYNNEGGQYLYFRSQSSQNNVLTLSDGGRIGINKNTDIIDYHSRFIGTGTNDAYFGGVYSGKVQRVYTVTCVTNLNGTDQWVYAYSVDNVTWTTNYTTNAFSTSAQAIERGVTVYWLSTTNHNKGDYWQMVGTPQLPLGTLTVAPDDYDEICTSANLTDGPWTDLSYNLSTIDDGNPNPILDLTTNSVLYLGSRMKRNAIYFDMATNAAGCTLVTEYWNGGSWTALNVATNLLFDGTGNLSSNGIVTWDKSTFSDWTTTNLTIRLYTNEYYWIRLRSSTAMTQNPYCYGVMPNGQYRFAVYAAKNDFTPRFYINGDGKVHSKSQLLLEGFQTNATEAATVKFVGDSIAQAVGSSTYYFHQTAHTVIAGVRNLQTYGPDQTNSIVTTNNISGTAKYGFGFAASNAITTGMTAPAGTWNVYHYDYVSSVSAGTVSRWIPHIVVYRAGGSTSDISSAVGDTITSTAPTSPQLVQTPVVCTNIIYDTGDRPGIELWATNSGAARNVGMVYEGNFPSRLITTFQVTATVTGTGNQTPITNDVIFAGYNATNMNQLSCSNLNVMGTNISFQVITNPPSDKAVLMCSVSGVTTNYYWLPQGFFLNAQNQTNPIVSYLPQAIECTTSNNIPSTYRYLYMKITNQTAAVAYMPNVASNLSWDMTIECEWANGTNSFSFATNGLITVNYVTNAVFNLVTNGTTTVDCHKKYNTTYWLLGTRS